MLQDLILIKINLKRFSHSLLVKAIKKKKKFNFSLLLFKINRRVENIKKRIK